MQISPEQLRQIEQARSLEFQQRLTAHLRKHHREQLAGYSDQQLHAYVSMCTARAQRLYRLQTEQAVACYAQLPVLLGRDFEIQPRYRGISSLLAQPSFEPNTRAKMALALAYRISSQAKR